MYPILCLISVFWGFPGGSVVKKIYLPVQETWVQSLGWEDPLEKEMATYSSSLSCTPVVSPGKSHGQRSLVDYSLGGRNRVRLDSATKTTTKESLFSGHVGCSLVFGVINNALLTFCLSASLCIYLLRPNLFSFHPNKLFLQL